MFNRGWPKSALDYVKNNGITDDDSYNYYASPDVCFYTSDQQVGAINGTHLIATNGNETLLR